MAKSLKEIIKGDFRFSIYEEETQKWLKKIPPLRKRTSENENVAFEDLERFVIKLIQKYGHKFQFISLTILPDEIPWYAASILDGETNERLETVYGITIYEIYAKVALFLYAHTRKEK